METPSINELIARTLGESDDPDTQTAFVVKCVSGAVVRSANQLPRGIAPTSTRTTRPAKYVYIMHAERSAIAAAARAGVALEGATGHLNWFPCSDCAASIIQAGIKCLVLDEQAYEARKDDPRYQFAESMEMLTEAGVEITWA